METKQGLNWLASSREDFAFRIQVERNLGFGPLSYWTWILLIGPEFDSGFELGQAC